MDRGISTKIVWVFAAEEAMASRFEHIEPPHILIAVLKFAEMSESTLGPYARDRHSKAFFRKEQDGILDTLEAYRIYVPEGSKQIRRALRKHLGKSDFKAKAGWNIHRSDASRRIGRRAETIAQAAGSRLVKASHMFEALLKSPSKLMVSVLEEGGAVAGPLDEKTQS